MTIKSTYQIAAVEKEEILELIISGEVTKKTLELLIARVHSLLEKTNAKALLCDIRALKGPRDNLATAYFRIQNAPVHARRFPTAVVEPRADPVYVSFYQMAAANAGRALRWFADSESARTWLKTRI